jgi:outer membrane protein assembly factor BamB
MPRTSNRIWVALVPPLAVVRLWRSPSAIWLKLLGTLGEGLLTLIYAGLCILFLVEFTGLQIEWRGGYIPALTYRKTAPNYDALDSNRSQARVINQRSTSRLNTNAYWTAFRGPRGDGVYDETPIVTNWPKAGLRLVWRQPIGGGYSSFAIAEGLAFTLEQRRDEEAATAYDLETGAETWKVSWKGRFKEYYSEEGPRTTPAYSHGKVYVLGALGELRCLEAATGKAVWFRNFVTDYGARVPSYGFCASPFILGEKLILVTGAGGGRSVICVDKENGKPIWSALDDRMSYATSILATLADMRQLVVCGETRTMGLAIDDGKLLWDYPWRLERGPSPIAQPVVLGPNRFLLSAGYFTGCAAVEVLRTPSGFAANTLWQNKNLKNKFTSSVLYEGFVYGLDEDVLVCLDPTTGKRKWREGRYGFGQMLLAAGHLIVLCGNGDLALVKASPEQRIELARFRALNGKTWNHLAVAGGKLLARNAVEMACYAVGQ